MKILFLHGWQSTPGGLKPTYFKDHGHEVLIPALPDSGLPESALIAVGTEHRLADPESLNAMLAAAERSEKI